MKETKTKRGELFFGEGRPNYVKNTCRWCGKPQEHYLYYCDECEMERTAMQVEEDARYHDSLPLGCGRRKRYVKRRESLAFSLLAGLDQ